MLITALLAKTTNNKVDPIAIQAKADMDGAFDARSLCHKVLVPFEKQFLNNALGGSNEPYLNKPARFKSISLTNAVRAGKDRAILVLLVEILSQVEDSNEASELLKKLYILFS